MALPQTRISSYCGGSHYPTALGPCPLPSIHHHPGGFMVPSFTSICRCHHGLNEHEHVFRERVVLRFTAKIIIQSLGSLINSMGR